MTFPTTLPEGASALRQAVAQLDSCFLNGFVEGQSQALSALPQIFAGTPLQRRIEESCQALAWNEFVETHFVTLAAARTALQGTLYDLLRQQALEGLRRPIPDESAVAAPSRTQPDPLLDSTRHWLMELAITGFARAELDAVQSFASTLAQLQANENTAAHGTLLTGFFHELLACLPIRAPEQVPLMRWCDLWSAAMLSAVGLAEKPAPTPVSGILYPVGLDLRQHSRAASIVGYGILVSDQQALFVRQTWTLYKVAAIQGDEIWLLFPDAQPFLDGLANGKALKLHDMPLLPSGDLCWNSAAAETGKKYKLGDVLLQHCAPGSALVVPALPPLERHPIQLAEPIALTDYRLAGQALHFSDGFILPLDTRRSCLSPDSIEDTNALFGLLRYDAGAWSIQVLTAGSAIGKVEFVGQEGADLLKKSPKSSTVSVLRERAGRLLRKTKTA